MRPLFLTRRHFHGASVRSPGAMSKKATKPWKYRKRFFRSNTPPCVFGFSYRSVGRPYRSDMRQMRA